MKFVDRVATDLETYYGLFRIEVFKDTEGKEHLALSMGDIADTGDSVLTRLHSECMTGDTLFSTHCDCGEQLTSALAQISQKGRGLLLYMRQEGRGIGLTAKLRAYEVQKHEGVDTFEANERLGLEADARDYGLAGEMLRQLGVRAVRLMTNNPAKVAGLEQEGIAVVEQVSMTVKDLGPRVKQYLAAKRKHGHQL